MAVPHKKKRENKRIKPSVNPLVINCVRCGGDVDEDDRPEDARGAPIDLCTSCQEDDADFIDSTMEVDD